jgi:hypothetical protein
MTTDILLEMKRRFRSDLKAGGYKAKALVLAPPAQRVVFWHTGGVFDAVASAQEAIS